MSKLLLGTANKLTKAVILGSLATIVINLCAPIQTASANVQLPEPLAISAGAGSAAGTIQVKFSANYGSLVSATNSGSTQSGSSVASLAIDTAGNLLYANQNGQTSIYIRTRNSTLDYSGETFLTSSPRAFIAIGLDPQNNILTIGRSGIYKLSRTNGTLGTGSWTESAISTDTALCLINSCAISTDGQGNVIALTSKLQIWKKSENFSTPYVIEASPSGYDFSAKGTSIAYYNGTGLVVRTSATYDFVNAVPSSGLGASGDGAIGVTDGLVALQRRGSEGTLSLATFDSTPTLNRVKYYNSNIFGCSGEFDPYGNFISGCLTGSPIQVMPKIAAVGQTYTAKVYAENGVTLIQTVNNYVSDTDITGLSGDTPYKVTITANASSGYLVSGASSMLSARTAVAPPSLTTNTISGTAIAQQVLTSNVTASGTISRVWKRDGSAISGATSGTYTLVEADIGTKITVTATATNGAGSASSTTVDFGPIAALAPTITGASLSGTPTYAQTLTATPSGITGLPAPTTSYVWNRDGSPISGAQSSTYTLTSSDIGTAISATITVTNGGGSASRTTTSSAQVSKISPTFGSWSAVTKTFGDLDFPLTAPSSSTPGTFTYSSATSVVISVNGNSASVAGAGTSVITATFTPTDTTNYVSGGTSTMTITVGKLTPTFGSWTGVTKTYGDASFALIPPTPSTPGTFTYTSGTTSAITVSGSTATVAGAGTSLITGTFAPTDTTNYNSGGTTTMTVTVGKATPTFTWSGVTKTYGDTNFSLTAPTPSTPGTFTYSSSTPSVLSVSASTATVVGAGTSTITATFTPTATANYVSGLTTSMVVTVQQRAQTTLTITSTAVIYGSTLTLTTSGGDGSGSVSYVVDSGPCTVLGSTLTPTGAGTCLVTATKAANGNYLAVSTNSTAVTVAKQTPTFTWSDVSKIYGETFSLTAPTPSTPGTFTYSSATTSVVIISTNSATVVSNGTSVITGTFTPNDATNFVSGGTITMTVSADRATITVTPTAGQSKVYGENNPNITYSVTSGALVGSDVLSGALTYTGSNAGSYPISIGTLTNSKYIITLTPVNFSITKATQAAVTLSSLSSAFSSSNKTVSLTGSGGTGTGSYQYALDNSNITVGCSVTGSTLSYTTAGTCVVAVKRTLDTNYLERTDAVSFSIGLASQTITFGSLSAKNYSSDTFTVSASSSASLTVVFTSGSPTICTTSGVSGSTITLLNVGTCVINTNQIGDSNVAAASQVSQNFTVNPRAITVTADAKTKVYGATDPTFTYTITTGSLVLGDAITGTLTRAAGTDVGAYQIQQGALTTANNPKYAITYIPADLTITRATPALVLTYPNSNVAILRPGAVDTPTVTTSSSSGVLTFATSAASSICTVDTTTGVISLFGAGSCPVAMSTAITTNFIQRTETTTVTVALLSTSLVGIDQTDLVSMGQPFFAHASVDQAYSFSSGNNGASVAIPAGALDPLVPISIHLLTDSADQRAMIGGTGTSVLSVVVSWVAPDGSVPNTNTGKAISVTLTNSAIKKDAKVFSIIGSESRLLGTALTDGSVTTLITEDPVLLVINPVVTTPAPSTSSSSSASSSSYVMSVAVDNSAAISVANDKLAADKAAAELKALQEKAAAIAAEEAALKAAKELADKQAQAAAELKASQEKAAAELRIAEELRLAKLAAEAELKAAAEKKAALDAAAAINKPTVTLYSLSSTLKLNAYDSAYLNKYVKSLKNGASVTCIGYSYSKNIPLKKATALAKSQATAVCALMKKTNKTLKTSVVVYPATKAPKAATGAKWVGVSYRIDGFKN
jgi:hypothetical protein